MVRGDDRGPYQFIDRIAEFHERRRNFGLCDALTPGWIPPVPDCPSSTVSIWKLSFFGHGPIELTPIVANDPEHVLHLLTAQLRCQMQVILTCRMANFAWPLQIRIGQVWPVGFGIPRRNKGKDCEVSERSEQRSRRSRKARANEPSRERCEEREPRFLTREPLFAFFASFACWSVCSYADDGGPQRSRRATS